MSTTSVVDPTGGANAWQHADITTDNTTGITTNVNYFLYNGGAIQTDFNASTGALKDAVFYAPTGLTVANYYGTFSNPAAPGNQFTQYTYQPGGALSQIVGIDSLGNEFDRQFGPITHPGAQFSAVFPNTTVLTF